MNTPNPSHMDQYGLINCSACDGTGYATTGHVGDRLITSSYPCAACQGTGKVLSWWPNAFVSMLVITGPILDSEPETLDEGRDPYKAVWRNGHVAWSAITHISQFTTVRHLHCRMPDVFREADRTLLTHQSRSLPGGISFESTKLHLQNDYVILGLPYNLVGAAWCRYLARREHK